MEKKVMSDYALLCTEEQTRKALELGAPIYHMINNMTIYGEGWFQYNGLSYCCPSAEQMLEWFRSKGLRFKIAEYADATYWQYHNEYSYKCGSESCYKDAVSSLIDAALDYLTNKVV